MCLWQKASSLAIIMNKRNYECFPITCPCSFLGNSKCQKQHACREIYLKEIWLSACRHYQEHGAWSNRLVQSTKQAHKRTTDPGLSFPTPWALLWEAQQKKKANTYTRVFFLPQLNKKPACKNVFSYIQSTLVSPWEDTKGKGTAMPSRIPEAWLVILSWHVLILWRLQAFWTRDGWHIRIARNDSDTMYRYITTA